MKNDSIQVIKRVSGRSISLPGDEIDTDRIIPARFMRVITFDGLGEFAFYDERFDSSGNQKEHPLNDPRFKGANILLVGTNFGCGSSREHAPQALKRYGIDAIIGVSFADIFAGNCVAIGIVAVTVVKKSIENLWSLVDANPELSIKIDLETKTVQTENFECQLNIPEASRNAFVSGLWDTTSVLLGNKGEIEHAAKGLPYTRW